MVDEKVTTLELRRMFETLQPGIFLDCDFCPTTKNRHYKVISGDMGTDVDKLINTDTIGVLSFTLLDLDKQEHFVLQLRFSSLSSSWRPLVDAVRNVPGIDFVMYPLFRRYSDTHHLEYFRSDYGLSILQELLRRNFRQNTALDSRLGEIIIFQILFMTAQLYEHDIYFARFRVSNFQLCPSIADFDEFYCSHGTYRLPCVIGEMPLCVALADVNDLYRARTDPPRAAIPSRWFVEGCPPSGILERDRLRVAMLNLAQLWFLTQWPQVPRHLWNGIANAANELRQQEAKLADAYINFVVSDTIFLLFLIGYPTDLDVIKRLQSNPVMLFLLQQQAEFKSHPQFDILARVENTKAPGASLVPLFRAALSWDSENCLQTFHEALAYQPFPQYRISIE